MKCHFIGVQQGSPIGGSNKPELKLLYVMEMNGNQNLDENCDRKALRAAILYEILYI